MRIADMPGAFLPSVMTRHPRLVGGTAVIALVAAFAFVMSGGSSAAPAAGQSDGIEVHGDWTIDVRDPDGTLVSSHQFQNALTDRGAELLGDIMIGSSTRGAWGVWLRDDAGDPPCRTLSDGVVPCLVAQDSYPDFVHQEPHQQFGGLSYSPAGGFRLYGSMTASRDGTISVVETSVEACTGSTSANDCPGTVTTISRQFTFTNKTLATPIDVVDGQVVDIIVDVSFS